MLWEKTGAVALVQQGLTAGWQAEEMLLHFEVFKIIYWIKHWNFSGIHKGTVFIIVVPIHLSEVFARSVS